MASREHYELASQYATEIASISEDKQGWERLAGAWNSKAEGQTMITWAMELSDITLPGLGLVTFLPSLAVKITGTATRTYTVRLFHDTINPCKIRLNEDSENEASFDYVCTEGDYIPLEDGLPILLEDGDYMLLE